MGQHGGQTKHKVEGIRVFVRIRPPALEDEAADGAQVVEANERGTCVFVRNTEQPNKAIQCTYDRVFGPESAQQDVFQGLVPALDTVLEGFNACVLAYGQTGSGKTHTLIGPGGGTELPENLSDWGVIPRAVQFLFDRLAAWSEEDETFSYSVSCSFLQIYNENLVDLLLQDGDRGRGRGTSGTNLSLLQIREEPSGKRGCLGSGCAGSGRRRQKSSGSNNNAVDSEDEAGGDVCRGRRRLGGRVGARPSSLHESRRVFVNGLSSFRVGGAQDVLRFINLGAANRRVRATQHNEASSRSHAVMQLMVETQSGGGGGGDDGQDGAVGNSSDHVTYRQAKLSLVDLAGSEKMDSVLNISRGHFNELRSINQSLSVLGNVISALSEKGRTHVPYRDSKLTRLLQDSLGGNTRTTIIACVNPLARQTNETVNTLQFADRAKKVMVRLRANEVVDDRVLLARAQAEIVRLKQLLRQAVDNTLGCARDDDVGGWVREAKPGNRSRNEGDTDANNREGDTEREHVSVGAPLSAEARDAMMKSSTVSPTAVSKPSAATAAHKRETARLIAENEQLREDNDRLRVDVEHLIQRSKQRKTKRRQRRGRPASNTPHGGDGGDSSVPPRGSSPVDWSARYAQAAAAARRRRPGSSTRSDVRNSGALPTPPRAESPASAQRPRTVPSFRRREFDDDEGQGEPIEELECSVEEQRDVTGQMDTAVSPGENEDDDKEEMEAANELERFRRELKRWGTGGVGGSGIPVRGEDVVVVVDGVVDDVSGESAQQLVQESQRLEDLMFEAQGKERRRLRRERERFVNAKTERLALEAELAALTSSVDGDGVLAAAAAAGAASPTKISNTSAAVPAAPVVSHDERDRHRVDEHPYKQQQQQQQQQQKHITGEGRNLSIVPTGSSARTAERGGENTGRPNIMIGGRAEPEALVIAHATPTTTSIRTTTTKPRTPLDSSVIETDVGAQSSSTAANGDGITPSRQTAPPATKQLPPERPRQTGWTTPPPFYRRKVSDRQRPATSSAGDGTTMGRTRSRRIRTRRWAGVRRSRSPVRNKLAAVAMPGGQAPLHQEHKPPLASGNPAAVSATAATPATVSTMRTTAGATSKSSVLQAMYAPYSSSASPDKLRGRSGGTIRPREQLRAGVEDPLNLEKRGYPSDGDRGGLKKTRGTGAEAIRVTLTHSAADLGLRLKVYSFRYDHFYECQVVGYDRRRRMHRCAYDATGEKQWHDLANKRFEVVGQNGVLLRSTESAPPPSTGKTTALSGA